MFPESDSSFFLIDAFDKEPMVKIMHYEQKIIEYYRNNNSGVPENSCNYFVITFDKDVSYAGTWNGKRLNPGDIIISGRFHRFSQIKRYNDENEI